MLRKRLAAAAAAALLTLGLAACGGGDGDDAEQATGPVKLRFLSLAWQKDSVAANQEIVSKWNAEHPDIQIEYVQGDWNSVHDQLLTSFEGGDAPDIFQYESASIGEFSKQGYLADLKDLVPEGLKGEISQGIWDSVTFDGVVAGVPFLLESQVVLANKKLLDAAGVAVPAADTPWTWDEFQANAQKLTKGDTYGVAWALKSPTNRVMNLSLNFDGKYFYDGEVRVGDPEKEIPRRIHDMIYTSKTAAPDAVGHGRHRPAAGLLRRQVRDAARRRLPAPADGRAGAGRLRVGDAAADQGPVQQPGGQPADAVGLGEFRRPRSRRCSSSSSS